MPSLADVQTKIRNALVEGSGEHALPPLLGGRRPGRRLGIHQRHYEVSLVEVLLGKFPACVWLVGGSLVAEVARVFARAHPPTAPCIAEYGAGFPGFLARRPEALRFPYLQSFAELEWHLSQIAIAVELSPADMDALATIDPGLLPDVVLRLQPGLRYFAAPWPVDELIELFLSEDVPERLAFEPTPVALELHGARGTFSLRRIDPAMFAFRSAIADGKSIGAAAESVFEADAEFDPGQALARLIAENLVTAVIPPNAGAPS